MSRTSAWTYLGLAIIFVASIVLASTLPAERALNAIAGNVGIVALIAALFQIIRDDSAYRRMASLQQGDQQFQLGVTSHMANTVFDKHIAFCEQYMEEVRGTLDEFLREGGSVDLIDRANGLYRIRREHALWVTAPMSEQLARFEDQMRKVGAQAHFAHSTAGQPDYATQRMEALRAMTEAFESTFPDLFDADRASSDEETGEDIMCAVRSILDIDRLVGLRAKLIERMHGELSD